MRIGVPAEITPGERRVAATPATVERLRDLGFDVAIESGAGRAARFPDANYEEAGATIVEERARLWSQADILLKIRAPTDLPDAQGHEADLLEPGAVLVSLVEPDHNDALVDRLAERGSTVFALDQVPRLSRAQSVDVLSSMASIAGYRAVIDAAANYGRFFGQQITAAGSTPPADVLVIGAGVAGLSAIATAAEMGARVRAFDVRPAVEKEVESLGAEFLRLPFETKGAEGEGGYAKEMDEEFLEAEKDLFREYLPSTDILITTASIPGRPAPKLIDDAMVESMRAGSVIVDLAAESGGNVELTEPDETVEHAGVQILGPTNLVSRLPAHASEYFGRNLANFMQLLGGAETFEIDEDDAVIRGMLVMRDGESRWPPPDIEPTNGPQPEPSGPATDGQAAAGGPPEAADEEPTQQRTGVWKSLGVALAATLMLLVGLYAPPEFVQHFTVFVLACFVGWQVIWNVTSSLHTPLMSVTNAISGIIIVGGILQVAGGATSAVLYLGAAAILVASINIFGGFLVTQRMLGMFRAEGDSSQNSNSTNEGDGHAR